MKTSYKIMIGVAIASLVAIVCVYIYLPILFIGPIEPLQFDIYNNDTNEHDIIIEVFGSNNKSIFKETYELCPKERINSHRITKRRGRYIFKITVDNEIMRTSEARVDHGRGRVLIDLYRKDSISGEAIPIAIRIPVV